MQGSGNRLTFGVVALMVLALLGPLMVVGAQEATPEAPSSGAQASSAQASDGDVPEADPTAPIATDPPPSPTPTPPPPTETPVPPTDTPAPPAPEVIPTDAPAPTPTAPVSVAAPEEGAGASMDVSATDETRMLQVLLTSNQQQYGDLATITLSDDSATLATIGPHPLNHTAPTYVPVRDAYTITVTSARHETFEGVIPVDPADPDGVVSIHLEIKAAETGSISIGAITTVPDTDGVLLESIMIEQADTSAGMYWADRSGPDPADLTLSGVPAGTYKVTLGGQGVFPWIDTVTVSPGEAVLLDPTLHARIIAMPPTQWAQSVDGAPVTIEFGTCASASVPCEDITSEVIDDDGNGTLERLDTLVYRWTPTYGYESDLLQAPHQFTVRFSLGSNPAVHNDVYVSIEVANNADDLVAHPPAEPLVVDGDASPLVVDPAQFVSGGVAPYHFTATSYDGVTATIADGMLSITPYPGWEGDTTVYLDVSDSGIAAPKVEQDPPLA